MTSEDSNEKKIELTEWFEKESEEINTDELNTWEPYAKLIVEFQELTHKYNLTQTEIAKRINSKQSVISRFINMGRLPSYDFLIRLSKALDGKLGITFNDNYMATLPIEKFDKVTYYSNLNKVSTKSFLQNLLNKAVDEIDSIKYKNEKELRTHSYIENANLHSSWLETPSSNLIENAKTSNASSTYESTNVALAN